MKNYTLGFPSALKRQKLKGGKTRILSTFYVTGKSHMPMFWEPKGVHRAVDLKAALAHFKAKFKGGGWRIRKVTKIRGEDSARIRASFIRPSQAGD